MIRRLTHRILRHYPQIYLACHVAHTRARTNRFGLTDKDVVLLGHLDEHAPLRAGPLARHLGIGAPALSAQLHRLEKLGYLTRTPHAQDRRRVDLHLTPHGAEALATTSILDPNRVNALLLQLAPAARPQAVDRLALLASAARRLQLKSSRRPSASR